MLTHLSIQNYTLVDNLDIEFDPGMTVVTGETGAGKSIMLDALGLCLGDRADPKTVRTGSARAEICAGFDVSAIGAARDWLAKRDYNTAEDDSECILRRTVTAEGRSRTYLNGRSITLQEASELGELLIDIHSQHAHQSLLRREYQHELLDAWAGLTDSVRELGTLADQWHALNQRIEMLEQARDERDARVQLLRYQVNELDELDLQAGEIEQLEADQKRLANAEHNLHNSQQAMTLIADDNAALDQLRRALQLVREDQDGGSHLAETVGLLDSACIQAEEARSELQAHIDAVEIDPEKLQRVEARLDHIFETARKHRVQAPELAALHTSLAEELSGLTGSDEEVAQLIEDRANGLAQYEKLAQKVSKKRKSAAKKLTTQVEKQLAELAMQHCRLTVQLNPRDTDRPHPLGGEAIEFRISTNPGSDPQPLAKIASGGELSRISLAIQVVAARTAAVPSMVFDEVDVGIGGAVAEVVGRLLHNLGEHSQVLVVTHLPQVAAQGDNHLVVAKTTDKKSARASLSRLETDGKIEEIARMLGGVKITDQSRAHAEEMLAAN